MTTAKASLRDRGSGRLEFADGALKFYVERGRFRKTSELIREIHIADVEGVAVVGSELSVTWRGVADVFNVESAESAKTLCDEVNTAMIEPKEAVEPEKPVEVKAEEEKGGEAIQEEAEEAPQQQETPKTFALDKMAGVALDVADSLFDILRGLQGRVDWNRVEGALKRSEESAKDFADEDGEVSLDFKGLSSAVKLHRSGEVSKEAYGVLKSLFEYFAELTVGIERLQKIRPTCEDAKKMVLAGYTLNDVALGVVVGDAEIEKESGELALVLESLAKETGVKIDVDAVKAAVSRLVAEKAAESVVAENRALLRKQLGELVTAV